MLPVLRSPPARQDIQAPRARRFQRRQDPHVQTKLRLILLRHPHERKEHRPDGANAPGPRGSLRVEHDPLVDDPFQEVPLAFSDTFVVVEFQGEEHNEGPCREGHGGDEVERELGEEDGCVDGVGREEECEYEEEPHLFDVWGYWGVRYVLDARDDGMMRVPLKIAEVKERCCPRCFVSSWLYLVSSVLLPPPSYLVAVVVVEG
ncbi:hypothetical protein FA13DRAFT_100744 [Coprinellus micaceus]|uniref:Uncharacterized protein n=1 Tax=Coprinellus micaceus TaxID=71717 RepID=A0A4Y7SIT3_COPMI|nr:hypothetical protein FA13DRAFT_100744 [Coprinellus micaceus]